MEVTNVTKRKAPLPNMRQGLRCKEVLTERHESNS